MKNRNISPIALALVVAASYQSEACIAPIVNADPPRMPTPGKRRKAAKRRARK